MARMSLNTFVSTKFIGWCEMFWIAFWIEKLGLAISNKSVSLFGAKKKAKWKHPNDSKKGLQRITMVHKCTRQRNPMFSFETLTSTFLFFSLAKKKEKGSSCRVKVVMHR